MADDPTPNLQRFRSYEHACREFRWLVPESFNIAQAIFSRHPDAVTRVALVEARPGALNTYTYGGLDYLSNKFAAALDERGVRPGYRVALVLPQSAAAIIAQFGALKLGAVVVPLALNLDSSALEFALKDSTPRAAVVHNTLRERVRTTGAELETVFAVNKLGPEFQDTSPDLDFWRVVFEASANFTTVATTAHSPAFDFYLATPERGLIRATHSHAALIYQLPAFEMSHNFEVGEGSTLWTPQDWASIDSSLCSVYPALWYGWRVAACETRAASHSPSLIERCEITSLVTTSAEVEALRESNQLANSGKGSSLRNLVCIGALPSEAHDWASESLGVSINTVHTNALFGSVAASCSRWYNTPRDSVGRAVPGYAIETIEEGGGILPPRREGRLTISREEPGASIEQATTHRSGSASSTEGRVVTGDVGFKDKDGNIWISNSE